MNFSTENIYRSNVLVLYPLKKCQFLPVLCLRTGLIFFTTDWGGVRRGVDCYSTKQKQKRGFFIHRLGIAQFSGYFLPELKVF
jgi:hypothetical protein